MFQRFLYSFRFVRLLFSKRRKDDEKETFAYRMLVAIADTREERQRCTSPSRAQHLKFGRNKKITGVVEFDKTYTFLSSIPDTSLLWLLILLLDLPPCLGLIAGSQSPNTFSMIYFPWYLLHSFVPPRISARHELYPVQIQLMLPLVRPQ